MKQNFAAEQAEVEVVIKTWLRHSGEKLKKLEAKTASARGEGNVNYMECWFHRTWQRMEGLRQGEANRHTEGTNFFVNYWFYNALKLTEKTKQKRADPQQLKAAFQVFVKPTRQCKPVQYLVFWPIVWYL